MPPPRQQNQLQSVVSIPDGSTVVVGGIELVTEGESESRVPLLGSIPVVREAFRSRAWNDNRQRFFVFIRAEIDRGRSFEGLRYTSDEAMDQVGLAGWPTVAPRVIRSDAARERAGVDDHVPQRASIRPGENQRELR